MGMELAFLDDRMLLGVCMYRRCATGSRSRVALFEGETIKQTESAESTAYCGVGESLVSAVRAVLLLSQHYC